MLNIVIKSVVIKIVFLSSVLLIGASIGFRVYLENDFSKNTEKILDNTQKQSINATLSAETISVFEELRVRLEEEKRRREILERSLSNLSVSSKSLTNEEIITKVKPAVVYIETNRTSGSGFIIENDGYVLTNAHVVKNYNWATVRISDGRVFPATIIGRDEIVDIALVKISIIGLPSVVLGNSDHNTLKQGSEIFTFGYPFGIKGDVSFKEGTLSRRLNSDGVDYLEISAEIHAGNSGGPLVDRLGQVVGINTFKFGNIVGNNILGESIKFALPINVVKDYIPDLKLGRNIVDTQIVSDSNPNPTPVPEPTTKPVVRMSLSQNFSQPIYYKTVKVGQSATIYWDVYGAYTCVASGGWSGSKSTYGSQNFSPNTTTNYRLTCNNSLGSTGNEVTIQIVE